MNSCLRCGDQVYGDNLICDNCRQGDDVIEDDAEYNDENVPGKQIKKINPPPFTEGHNPFGKGGIYTPGDPGL